MTTIEKVKIEDAEELLEIYGPYVKNTAISFEYEVPSTEEFKKRIENISAKYPYIKAVTDSKIVGYAYAGTFKDRKAYDWSVETTVYVRDDCKRNGIGRMLYDALEKSLAGIGVRNLNACIASPSKEDAHLNDDSCRFHEAMGYSLVGRFHNSGYKFGCWYDMIWMEKIIDSSEEPTEVKFGEWDI